MSPLPTPPLAQLASWLWWRLPQSFAEVWTLHEFTRWLAWHYRHGWVVSVSEGPQILGAVVFRPVIDEGRAMADHYHADEAGSVVWLDALAADSSTVLRALWDLGRRRLGREHHRLAWLQARRGHRMRSVQWARMGDHWGRGMIEETAHEKLVATAAA